MSLLFVDIVYYCRDVPIEGNRIVTETTIPFDLTIADLNLTTVCRQNGNLNVNLTTAVRQN